MALGTWFGQGGAICFAIGTTQHEATLVGVRETVSTQGGDEFTTADGVVHRNSETGSITSLEVTMVQDLASAALWRYLRETTPTSATIQITGTSSTTEGASNPEWVYTVTSWVLPPLEWTAGSGMSTPTARFTVSANPTVDTTP